MLGVFLKLQLKILMIVDMVPIMVSNKKIRQTMNIPLTGNGYRKVFDYQWIVW